MDDIVRRFVFKYVLKSFWRDKMEIKKIDQIFSDTAYSRMAGTSEERKCADYLTAQCAEMGLTAHLEEFEVEMATIKKAVLLAGGKEIPCKGYFCSGSSEVEAPLYYLPHDDTFSLSACKGKIVMIDGYLGYWRYHDIVANGAVGFITYSGNANYADEDIDQRELRSHVSQGKKIPGVNINVKSAIELVRSNTATVKIILDQEESIGKSHNVVLDLPGEIDETILLTAHYDTTSLSQGAYDNMSGSIGLLGIAEKFAKEPRRYGLRFVWCGSEERGLLGSQNYVAAHEAELENIVLNVNLDMIGCIMGKLIACCTCDERLAHYLQYSGCIRGVSIKAYQGVLSSDSASFADMGIPAVSFARVAPDYSGTIHSSYDTAKLIKTQQMVLDIDYICHFVGEMVNARCCPVAREIPEKMKEKLDIYFHRAREEN